MTEINRVGGLEHLKLCQELMKTQKAICEEFGGLTVNPKLKGYWVDETGAVISDSVETWLIYADSGAINEKIRAFNERIKKITAQKSQAYGIDGKLYFV
jgi:hypothetical protein